MGITIENGQAKIHASYGLKVPAAPNNPNSYAMHDFSTSVSISFDVEGDTTNITKSLEPLAAGLEQQVKLAVFAALNVEFTETSDGVLVPSLPTPTAVAAQAAPAAPQAQYTPQPQAGGGQGTQSYGPPKASKEEINALPVFVADFGDGQKQYRDQRPLKEAGKYGPKSADFREVGGQSQGWIYNRDGSVNVTVVAAAAAANVPGLPVPA